MNSYDYNEDSFADCKCSQEVNESIDFIHKN